MEPKRWIKLALLTIFTSLGTQTAGAASLQVKDTSLVIIIGLFDLMKTTKVTLSNPEWMGFSTEAYIFIAILYFAGWFSSRIHWRPAV